MTQLATHLRIVHSDPTPDPLAKKYPRFTTLMSRVGRSHQHLIRTHFNQLSATDRAELERVLTMCPAVTTVMVAQQLLMESLRESQVSGPQLRLIPGGKKRTRRAGKGVRHA